MSAVKTDFRMVLFVALIILSAVLRVETSGYLQVGFFMYEFRHDPTTVSADITEQADVSTSSDDVKSDKANVTGGSSSVIPWKLRSRVPAQGAGSPSPKDAAVSSAGSLWQSPASCNETSSPRPQYQFLLCLDYVNSKPGSDPCQLGKFEIKTFSHLGALRRDLVTFPSALAMTSNGTVSSNPIIFGFDRWNGHVLLKVHVRCCGVSANRQRQCEETLTYTIHHTPAPFTIPLSPQNVMLTGRSRLVLYLLLQCDEDYYGPKCDRRCRVDYPSIEHAFCNVTTGERQCLPGWEGPECQIDTDECRYNYCQNGAHCVNSPPGSFTCQCQLGTSGRLCQIRSPICHTFPCQNDGTCHDSRYGFVCFCPRGFAGYRCEQTLHINLDNLDEDIGTTADDIGNTAYSNNTRSDEAYLQGRGWKDWYSAFIVCGLLLIVLLIVVCCLFKSRIFPLGISSKGSFYSVFITAKTYDNVMYDHDERSDSIINESIIDDMAIYQNVLPTQHARYVVDMDSRAGSFSEARGESPPCFRSHLSTPRSSDGGQYIDLINASVSSNLGDYEGLPNLVDPRRSPFMVHRNIRRLSPVYGSRSGPVQLKSLKVHRPNSDSLNVPKFLVTQHDQPVSGTPDSFGSFSESCDSPKSLPASFEFPRFFPLGNEPPICLPKSSDFSTSFSQSCVREVYAIGGSLSTDDLTSTFMSRPRKSLLDRAMHTRRKNSEPKLCSIRRVDSAGYEIPIRLHQTTSALRHHYTTLHRSKVEEHIYDEIRSGEQENEAASRREMGIFTPRRGSKIGHVRAKSYTAFDGRASESSETGRYAKIDEHYSAYPGCMEKPKTDSSNDKLSTTPRKLSHDEEMEDRYSEEPTLANKTDKVKHVTKEKTKKEQAKSRGKYPQHLDTGEQQVKKRRSPLCYLFKRKDKRDKEHVQQNVKDNHVVKEELAQVEGHVGENDENSYENVCDTDDDVWDNTDYIDVFTRTSAAV